MYSCIKTKIKYVYLSHFTVATSKLIYDGNFFLEPFGRHTNQLYSTQTVLQKNQVYLSKAKNI